MESYVLVFFWPSLEMPFIAAILSRQVPRWSLELGRILHSEWIHPGRQLTVIFRRQMPSLGFLQGWEVFKWSCALGLPCQHILRLLCLGPVPNWQIPLSGCWERSQFFFRLKSLPWVIFSTFKGHFYFNQLKVELLWAIRHLCSSSQEDSYFGKKKRDGSCLSAELFGQVPPSNCRIVIWKEKETLRARLGCRLPSCAPRPEEMICRGSWEPESNPPESQNAGWRYAEKLAKAVLELLSLAGAQRSTSGQYLSSLCPPRSPVVLAGGGYPAERGFLLVLVHSLPFETPGSSQVPLIWQLCCLPGYRASWS